MYGSATHPKKQVQNQEENAMPIISTCWSFKSCLTPKKHNLLKVLKNLINSSLSNRKLIFLSWITFHLQSNLVGSSSHLMSIKQQCQQRPHTKIYFGSSKCKVWKLVKQFFMWNWIGNCLQANSFLSLLVVDFQTPNCGFKLVPAFDGPHILIERYWKLVACTLVAVEKFIISIIGVVDCWKVGTTYTVWKKINIYPHYLQKISWNQFMYSMH